MGQLFLWTNRVDRQTLDGFRERYGFSVPEPLADIHENLPQEFIDYLHFFSLDEIVEESRRYLMMVPGLIPFAEDGEGDMYCFYRPWMDSYGAVPCGIWMNETNHFLPISNHFQGFLIWWIGKGLLDAFGEQDWEETVKILKLVQQSSHLEEFGVIEGPPQGPISWNEQLLRVDVDNAFSLTYSAIHGFARSGISNAIHDLKRAQAALPQFGAPYLWEARLQAMRGHIRKAHDAYFNHLTCPLFSNGFHYWTQCGDLQVPESSEREAFDFLYDADLKASDAILLHPRVDYLHTHDPDDYQARLELSEILWRQGNRAMALTELENAFFLESWNEDVAGDLLERLLDSYQRHDRPYEERQCGRLLKRAGAGSFFPL